MTANLLYDIKRNIMMEYGDYIVASLLHDIGYFWKVKKYLKILNAYRKYFH
jgi:hypothetical protein